MNWNVGPLLSKLKFLRFLTFRDHLTQLGRLQYTTLLKIAGVGQKYARLIQKWQRKASFSTEVEYVGPMIITDARRILELLSQIHTLDEAMAALDRSSWPRRGDPRFSCIFECGSEGYFP